MREINKVVLPVAGLGTRLIPITKELPKEMLPIFIREGENILVKPVVQVIFEQLYDVGIRSFCFIVGRTKRTIEDYFTPDYDFLRLLRKKNKTTFIAPLEDFYNKIINSTIVFVNQPEPLGFGDAVLRAAPFVGSEAFIVHAGDDIILSKKQKHIIRLEKAFLDYGADAAFLLEHVVNPKAYGVIKGKKLDDNTFLITDILEKPEKPPTNIAVVAVYIFKNSIFHALREIASSIEKNNGELQLTDAIRYLMSKEGKKVIGVLLEDDEERIDIGSVESYYRSLRMILRQSENMR